MHAERVENSSLGSEEPDDPLQLVDHVSVVTLHVCKPGVRHEDGKVSLRTGVDRVSHLVAEDTEVLATG